jgi:hypothetical protein
VRFGGHETFAIREGWLHRGLKLLLIEPHKLTDEYAADWLGVGRSMAKAIRYWLVATDLAGSELVRTGRGRVTPEPTELARLIWERDRHFLEQGTWWALHANLVNNPRFAFTWGWFFSQFSHSRFERAVALESLLTHLRLSEGRPPSAGTVQRDLGCLLASYSRDNPPSSSDAEEGQECPLQELDLLVHFKGTGMYQRNRNPKNVPFELFGYACALAFPSAASWTEVLLSEATSERGGPGRVFQLDEEGVFDLGLRYEAAAKQELRIVGHAGERALRIRTLKAIDWIRAYYERLRAGEDAA